MKISSILHCPIATSPPRHWHTKGVLTVLVLLLIAPSVAAEDEAKTVDKAVFVVP